MALQIAYTSPQYDIELPTAYAKIDNYRGNINEVQFEVLYYSSQTARFANKNPIGLFQFTMPYTDGMTYSAVYNYLKTLPDFDGAIDV